MTTATTLPQDAPNTIGGATVIRATASTYRGATKGHAVVEHPDDSTRATVLQYNEKEGQVVRGSLFGPLNAQGLTYVAKWLTKAQALAEFDFATTTPAWFEAMMEQDA